MSQAWTRDDGAALDGYVAAYRDFLALHRAQPGFRGRRLLVDEADRTHVVNLRFFDSPADYDALVASPGYAEHIDALSVHLDLSRPPTKAVLSVAVTDGPADGPGAASAP